MSRFLSALRGTVSRRMSSQLSRSPAPSLVICRNPTKEPSEEYKPGGYHPIKPGDFLHQRYEVVSQLGWGQHSTVWLVQDLQKNCRASMKVLKSSLTDDTTGWDERGILRTLHEQNPQALGYHHVCQWIDDFVHQGPNGSHICIVTELMGPTILDLHGVLPLSLVKRISKHMLLALQYMHDDCDMVHTDIKADNIFMTGAVPPVHPATAPLPESELATATFVLGDMSSTNRVSNRYAQVIQPGALRAPEVALGAEWDTKADIWNFGCVIYELARGAVLFDPHWNLSETGWTPAQTHLAQMAGLLGEFPRSLLQRGKDTSQFFDEQGRLLRGAGAYGITIEDLLGRAGHSPEDVVKTADFLLRALVLDPTQRWSATRLLQHPWLDNIH